VSPASTGPWSARPERIVVIGDSNGNGTTVDATHGGAAIPAGWTVRDAGANLATWPAGTTPSVGAMPYLIALATAAGSTGGWIIRRSVNGSGASDLLTSQFGNVTADVTALANGTPELVVIVTGANDAQSTTERDAYPGEMRHAIEVIRERWPSARIVCVGEHHTSGSYDYLPDNVAALAVIEGEYGTAVRYADCTAHALADGIHFSQSAGGGQEDVAATVWTEATS
jgi:hypothetical protein